MHIVTRGEYNWGQNHAEEEVFLEIESFCQVSTSYSEQNKGQGDSCKQAKETCMAESTVVLYY